MARARDVWTPLWLQGVGQDLRYAMRIVKRYPGFATAMVLTLMLGIGMTTALFSVVEAVILRPLPYFDAHQLVILWTRDELHHISEGLVSYPNYEDWRTQNRVFRDVAICTRSSPVTLTGITEPERLEGASASANLFSVLGVNPLFGRTYSTEEAYRGESVVLVSHSFWQRRFAGSKDILGRMMDLDGRATTIVGVMPSWFQFPSPDVQLWMPLRRDTSRERPIGLVVARLTSGANVDQARSEMNLIANRLADQYPALASNPDFAGFRANIIPLDQQIIGKPVRVALWTLLGAVVCVLLIACSNAANLFLARGSARQPELAVRTALGASRTRLIRQLLAESMALSFTAGMLGIIFSTVTIRVFVALAPTSLPRLETVTVNGMVLLFTISISVASALAFGVLPAWQASQIDPQQALRAGGRGQVGNARRRGMHDWLVASEFAITVVLVCGAGLFIRSVLRVGQTTLGFNPQNVLVFRVVLPNGKTDSQQVAFYQEALARLRALPGALEAGAISNLFLSYNPDTTIIVEGKPETAQSGTQIMDDAVSPDLFATLGVPLRRGRFFTEQDRSPHPPVAVINESVARRFWHDHDEDAIGKRFQFADGRFGSTWVTVVGIVADMRRAGVERDPLPQVFLPLAELPSRGTDLVLRTKGDPLGLAPMARRKIATMEPTVPVYRVTTLEHLLDAMVTPRRFQTALLAAFAVVSLLLSAVGIYGVMHYLVTQRTTEIGIRLALGASRADVFALVLREGLAVATVGLGIGICVAFALSRAVSSSLYGVASTDPATFVLSTFILIAVATLACLQPAWAATRVDPHSALQ
jgi:predicted permease